MEQTSPEYFDNKWKGVIAKMPHGGNYRFDLRSYGYKIIANYIGSGKKVFDYACGLGVINKFIEKEGSRVDGCDMSRVAINYVNETAKGTFRTTKEIFNSGYDYITAIYLLEHVENPVGFVDMCLSKGKSLIVALPNNFSKTGEHIHMGWSDWKEFYHIFSAYNIKRLDEGKYPTTLTKAFQHPILEFTRKVKNVGRKTKQSSKLVQRLYYKK